jgi:hypothetical protein
VFNGGGLSAVRKRLGITRQYAKWLVSRLPKSTLSRAAVEPTTSPVDNAPQLSEAFAFRARALTTRLRELGSLAALASETGLSRQRAHQIISRGAKAGLYASPFRAKHQYPDSATFCDAYQNATSIRDFCRRTRSSSSRLTATLSKYGLTVEQLEVRLGENKKQRKERDLMRLLRPFLHNDGSLPSTYELQSTPHGRTVYSSLIRHYGSYAMVRSAVRRGSR